MHFSDLESVFSQGVADSSAQQRLELHSPELFELFSQIQYNAEIKDLFSFFPRDAFQNLPVQGWFMS